ncbi:PucR family transcriptional regulator [Pseudonocardia spinosispora]|uniref:PucR family transcriptional regulator n=1 Tax=Pseudonocardia spinosispora TaxID=103441 RepID=UPI00146FB1AA|nr:PucR family transcriptional regulator [Pseudonocardia spinosispora]
MTELLSQSALGLRLLAGAGAVHREISWAHVSELADPAEFMRGGELLLLTGVNLPTATSAQREYVGKLAEAGAAAIGFGIGLSWDEVPPELVVAAEDVGLPLLEVPRAVPFLAITRAVAAALSRREQAAKDRVLRAQRALTTAAVRRDSPASVLEELATLTGGWGLLLNRAGAVVAGSRATTAEVSARRSALTPDLTRLRDAPGAASLVAWDGPGEVWVQSLHAGEELLGFLAVGRGSALTPVERQTVNAAVPLCTLLLDRSRTAGHGARRLRTAVLRLLFDGRSPILAEVAGDLWNGLPAEPLLVLRCRGSRNAVAAARDRLAADRSVAEATVLHGELDDDLLCLCSDGPDEKVLLTALADVDGLCIGISAPAGYPDLSRADDEAGQALAHGAPVTRFRDLPPLALLSVLPADVAATFSASALAALGPDPELRRSLHVWLAHHGQWDPASAELGVHRHTLRNRIRKVERLLSRDLSSADVRAELWLALRLAG